MNADNLTADSLTADNCNPLHRQYRCTMAIDYRPLKLETPEMESMEKHTQQAGRQQGRGTRGTGSRGLLLGLGVVAAAAAVSLTGCSSGLSGAGAETGVPVVPAVAKISGSVHGGQQAVTGATIQLYTVGTSGIGSAATPLLTTTVTTSTGTGSATGGNLGNGFNTLPAGSFNITADYSCTNATLVYLVATGGNSGSGTNGAISEVAALGSCATLLANALTTTISVDELTTVAAAYALAPYSAGDYTNIGATGSNPAGLVNAFATAASLVNTSTGAMPGASLPAGATIPSTEINTLADILAACVNTTKPGSATTGNCGTLFTAAAGTTATFASAVYIAKHPAAPAITALYTLPNPQSPYQPVLGATQPNDFTIAVNYSANGALISPYSLAFDAAGDAFVANEGGASVTELSNTGTVVTTLTGTGLFGPQAVAVDRTGNVWVANTAGNSVMKFPSSGGTVANTPSVFTAGGINAPSAIALDSAGNAFIANFNGNTVTGLNSTGTALAGSPFGTGYVSLPSGIAIGTTGTSAAGYVLVTSSNGTIAELTNAGAYVTSLTDNTLQGPLGVAVDNTGHVFATGSTTGTAIAGALSEFAGVTPKAVSPVQTGLFTPYGVATDSVSVWVANSTTSGSLAQLNYGSATPVSPAAGYGSLNTPVGVAIDNSGNVWTANSGSGTVSKFIGLAVPVTTPLAANVGP